MEAMIVKEVAVEVREAVMVMGVEEEARRLLLAVMRTGWSGWAWGRGRGEGQGGIL